MTNSDQQKEDEVLKRMLKTPPKGQSREKEKPRGAGKRPHMKE
jgi:hypothetical protein